MSESATDIDQLMPLVYEELRKLACHKMANEGPQTIGATALVHEAYLRLESSEETRPLVWQNRRHFFGAAAEAMRRILIDRARARAALKRGGDVSMVDEAISLIAAPERDEEITQVSDALDRFAKIDPFCAELVRLKYFAGLTWEEISELVGESTRNLRRRWAYAKAWLHDAISESRDQ